MYLASYCSYNTSQHDSTKFILFEVVFVFKAVLPIEIGIKKRDKEGKLDLSCMKLLTSMLVTIVNLIRECQKEDLFNG